MAERSRPGTLERTFLVLAALVGTLAPSVLGAVCLARFLPLEEGARAVVGLTLAIPLWCAASCFTFLSRSAARAWLACSVTALVLGIFAFEVP